MHRDASPPPSEPAGARRSLGGAVSAWSLRRPRAVLLTVLIAVCVASIGFVRLAVDTDPENMLPADDPVRQLNSRIEEQLGVRPMLVVGLFGSVESADVVAAIDRVHDALAARADVVAESTFGVASVFDEPPSSDADIERLVATVASDPVLAGNVLFAEDAAEPGAAIFVALREKGAANEVAAAASDLVAAEPALAGLEHAVAGQPLAEDAFGRQMFIQMGIFAPLAGMLVFALLWLFFRRLPLVLAAMALAMATVIITMGTLVGSGNTLHIMSSMIPIFLMPIAILDSVHILSEFFDRHRPDGEAGDQRAETISAVMADLRRPIGFTSLTTAVGFGALVLVPIPPVRVFGVFVAFGVGLAWLLTFTLLPAMLVWVDERRLVAASAAGEPRRRGVAAATAKAVVTRGRWAVIGLTVASAVVAIPALASLTVNDNPVRWFRADHEVRQSTDRLGAALPGTFTASLIVTEATPGALDQPETARGLAGLASALSDHPEVGGVQVDLSGRYRLLRSDDTAHLRLQLRTGDNTAMQAVVDQAEAHLVANPIDGVLLDWAGEAYLNLTWQQKMVSGMLVGFGTTLVAIFVLLFALFRSLRWALLAMVPVALTVLVGYGAMALLGRDIDMPVAVLSTMVLGIGVDFSIHFVERFRALIARLGTVTAALDEFYAEPARALTRNAVVIAVGFSPLLLSSLVPYVVVGVLLASIVTLSWLASVVVLPAMVSGSPDRSRIE